MITIKVTEINWGMGRISVQVEAHNRLTDEWKRLVYLTNLNDIDENRNKALNIVMVLEMAYELAGISYTTEFPDTPEWRIITS